MRPKYFPVSFTATEDLVDPAHIQYILKQVVEAHLKLLHVRSPACTRAQNDGDLEKTPFKANTSVQKKGPGSQRMRKQQRTVMA